MFKNTTHLPECLFMNARAGFEFRRFSKLCPWNVRDLILVVDIRVLGFCKAMVTTTIFALKNPLA